jgi:hypothetical protein
MMNKTGLNAVGLILITILASCSRRGDTGAPVEARQGVLESLPASNPRFELAIDNCANGLCPVQVRLLDAGKIVDIAGLPVAAHSQQVRPEDVTSLWGADLGLTAWASGDRGAYVSTAVRLVQLTSQTTALLVTQRHGYEHLKRDHVLLAPADGKLKTLWSAKEPDGTTWSATRIVPSPGGPGEAVVHISGFFYPVENLPDKLQVKSIQWDSAAGRIREDILPSARMPLFVLNAGLYDNVVEARKARTHNDQCLGSYFVLDTSPFPELRGRRFAVAQLATSHQEALNMVGQTLMCSAGLRPGVVEWSQER